MNELYRQQFTTCYTNFMSFKCAQSYIYEGNPSAPCYNSYSNIYKKKTLDVLI